MNHHAHLEHSSHLTRNTRHTQQHGSTAADTVVPDHFERPFHLITNQSDHCDRTIVCTVHPLFVSSFSSWSSSFFCIRFCRVHGVQCREFITSKCTSSDWWQSRLSQTSGAARRDGTALRWLLAYAYDTAASVSGSAAFRAGFQGASGD